MKKINRYKLQQTIIPYIFLTPAFIIFGIYLIFPVFYALYMSFFNWGSSPVTTFIGFDNYINMFQDKLFRTSVYNTLIYTCAVPVKVIIALLLAVLLNQKIKCEKFFRGALFFPYIMSEVIVALVWQTMFTPNYGFINTVLGFLGLEGQRWLVEPDRAMLVVMIVSTWKGLGANLIVFIAGIKGISKTYYEAASIDGASAWQTFRHITIPCLRPTTVFVVTMSIIGSFKVFDLVYIMTKGGPGNSTKTLVQYIYEMAFNRFQFGYASAVAVIFFVVLFTLTILQRKLISQSED